MRPNITVIVSIYFISHSLLAQPIKSRFTIMPQVGVTWSKLVNSKSPHEDHDYEIKSLSSSSYGFLVQYSFSDLISIRTGFFRETKGATGTYETLEINQLDVSHFDVRYYFSETDVRNQYGTVPLFLRFTSKNRLSVFGDIGGYLSRLESVHVATSSVQYHVITDQLSQATFSYGATSDKSHTKNFDIGFLVGGGLSYRLSNHFTAQLAARIDVGLKKLDKVNSDEKIYVSGPTTEVKVKNYYGLSSYSRNLMYSLNVGLSYKPWAE